MAEGNVFFIKSHMHGKVLDVAGGHGHPGAQVIIWDQKWADYDNQLWYEDPATGTIRSQASHLCLEAASGGNLMVNEYSEGNEDQQWKCDGSAVRNREDEDRVLDIGNNNHSSGASICSWNYHGGSNQGWYFEYQPASYFYIRSQMNGKVLDVKNCDEEPGAKVITFQQNDFPSDNQLWYLNRKGFISSRLNGLVWDSSDDGKICMQEYEEDNEDQTWTIVPAESKIVLASNPDMSADIKGSKDKDKAKIVSWEYHGGDNQRWTFEYIFE